MRQDTLRMIVKSAFWAGWAHRNQRPITGAGRLIDPLPVDDMYCAAEAQIADYWVAEMLKFAEI